MYVVIVLSATPHSSPLFLPVVLAPQNSTACLAWRTIRSEDLILASSAPALCHFSSWLVAFRHAERLRLRPFPCPTFVVPRAAEMHLKVPSVSRYQPTVHLLGVVIVITSNSGRRSLLTCSRSMLHLTVNYGSSESTVKTLTNTSRVLVIFLWSE